jgi:hypothetical protein
MKNEGVSKSHHLGNNGEMPRVIYITLTQTLESQA